MATLQLVLATVVLVLAAEVSCLPGGAPLGACNGLSPSPALGNHNVGPQPQDNLPFMLGGFADAFPVDENGTYGYVPGATYMFTVTSMDGQTTFRGVLLQGRAVEDDSPVGTFNDVDDDTRQSSCANPESGITHNSRSDKMSVDIEWVAPPEGTGYVQIGWAVVQTLEVYWANVRSPMLQELPVPDVTTTESGSVITTGSLLLLAVLGLVAAAI